MKAFDDLKNKQKVHQEIFLICKSMYILKIYSVHYNSDKNTNVNKNSLGQNKRYKKCPLLFFWEIQLNSTQFYF